MPADTRIDDCRAGSLDGFGQHHRLFPAAAVGNQVNHGQAINDDEVFAHCLPGALDNLNGQAHALCVVATPLIGALVGVCDQELVDEIAFRSHDLNAVVASLSCERGAANEIAYLFFHTGCR